MESKKPKLGWFKANRGKLHTRQVIAFDIEGVGGRGGFVCGSIVGDYIREFHTSRQAMSEALIYYALEGFWIFSHNLQYDLPILEGPDFPAGEMTFTKYGLLWSSYRKGKRKGRIFDSTNLFPRMSVASMGEMVYFPKLELPEEMLRRLANYSAWSDFSRNEQELIRRYCERDSEIVFIAVNNLQELVNRLGGELKPTIAGVAMDLYRRKFHKWPWQVVGPRTNELCREAFYGGRVENFAVGQVSGVSLYDVTSLYAHIQKTARFPHPSKLKLDLKPGKRGEWLQWEGVAQVEIEIPETFIPMLPFRARGRLFFPFGTLEGWWPICEIRQALEMGAKLKDCNLVIGSPVTFNPFVEFVDTLFELRQYYSAHGSPYADLVKLILNSLYGRWGLDPRGSLFTLVDMDAFDDLEKLRGYSTQIVNNKLLAYGTIETARQPDYSNVLFAAQIAAEGRLFLLDELTRQGEAAIYCDTDSIITSGAIETGSGLGSWRVQMDSGSADLIGPKEYAVHNRFHESSYRAKGIPPRVAQQYLETGVARYLRAVPIREAISKGLDPSTWVETFKSHKTIIPKRYVSQDVSGGSGEWSPTFPYQVEELEIVLFGKRAERTDPIIHPGLAIPLVSPASQTELDLMLPSSAQNPECF